MVRFRLLRMLAERHKNFIGKRSQQESGSISISTCLQPIEINPLSWLREQDLKLLPSEVEY